MVAGKLAAPVPKNVKLKRGKPMLKWIAVGIVAVIFGYFLVKWLVRLYFNIIFYGELEP